MDDTLEKMAASLMGRKGGLARAAKLSPERRRAIAKKANRAMQKRRTEKKAAA